jgi:hypothetical protein
VVGAERLLADGKGALQERLGLGVVALDLGNRSQPGNGRGEFCVVLAMFLTGQGHVLLGYRNRIGVLGVLFG